MEPELILALIIAVFFLGRALFLWYFKVNDIIKNQNEQNRLLRKIAGEPELIEDKKGDA